MGKVKEFYRKHRKVINGVAIGLAGAAVGGFAAYKISQAAKARALMPEIPKLNSPSVDDLLQPKPAPEEWKPDKNFEDMVHYSRTHKLAPGECFVLFGIDPEMGPSGEDAVIGYNEFSHCDQYGNDGMPDEDWFAEHDVDPIGDIDLEPEEDDLEEAVSEKKKMPDYLTKGWNESYRAGWDAVNDLAKSLVLRDHETYMIERNDEYGDGENIVSHLVDNFGVYPPDEEV